MHGLSAPVSGCWYLYLLCINQSGFQLQRQLDPPRLPLLAATTKPATHTALSLSRLVCDLLVKLVNSLVELLATFLLVLLSFLLRV